MNELDELLKNIDDILKVFSEAGHKPKITISEGAMFFDTHGDSLTPEIRERLWELGVNFNKESEQFYLS